MKLKVLGSSVDAAVGRFFAASYVINGRIAVDAGSIGLLSSLADQKRIKAVFLTHPHFDHIASLPIFLDNVYEFGAAAPSLYGSEYTLECLRRHVFNDRLWPDLFRLSQEESPFLTYQILDDRQSVQLDGLTITAVEVTHGTPTFGYLIEDESAAVAIVSDTSPTEEIWQVAASNRKLCAVFIESAFPNSMAWLAEKARHLTPKLVQEEHKKLKKTVPLYVMHIKPAFQREVIEELAALDLPQLQVCVPNTVYHFP